MPLTIIGDLSGNRLDVDPSVIERANGTVTLLGTDNALSIDASFVVQGLVVTLGGGSHATIGAGCVAGNLHIHAQRAGRITIGDGSAFNGVVRLLAHEEGRIAIGRGCLFGSDVDVSVSDMHSILDAATGTRLNPARDIVIGDRVWVGYRALIWKGSQIGSGSVVGAQSFVTGVVAPNTLIAGYPARVVRQGVDWSADLL